MPDTAFVSRRDSDPARHTDAGLRARAGAIPHRLPTRIAEPPFDDDTPPDVDPGVESVQGTLALAFALSSGLPAVPRLPVVAEPDRILRRLALVPPIEAPPAPKSDDAAPSRPTRKAARRRAARDVDLDDFGPQRTPRALLPEPKPWAGRFVQAIVEVTSGARPIGQLVRWTSTDVYESVYRRIAHRSATQRMPRRTGAIVRSIHLDEPVDGVAEVCAVVQEGGRCRAIALRLEGVDGRWQCTALQIG